MSDEVWKDIAGYEGLYAVSSLGRVRSLVGDAHRRKRIMRSGGIARYNRVTLCDGAGSCVCRSVHRLVAEAFVPNPNGLPCVNHKDANKRNNSADNLEWVTPAQNSAHARRAGLLWSPCGSNRSNAKLTEEDVASIRLMRNSGATLESISSEFGISQSNAFYIVSRKTWRHVA